MEQNIQLILLRYLDALPVWFLGYEPQMYRTFFSFGWKFTFDEFKSPRAKVSQMDAIIFQEINAIEELEQAKQEILQAKQQYQQAEDVATKQQAIAAWQQCANLLNKAIAMLNKVPLEDAGYLETQTLLATYEAELGKINIRRQEELQSQ